VTKSGAAAVLVAAIFSAACGNSGPSGDLVFVDGRAVAAAGDSVLAWTQQGVGSVILRDRGTGATYTRGGEVLQSPHHIQEAEDRWYVSDAADGEWWVVEFSYQWDVLRRIRVDTITTTPHQFAVLPNGEIIVEAPDGRLVSIAGDTLRTFALTETSRRTGLLLGALGGVLHAVPDKSITLYNQAGNIRWRLPWEWQEGAYVTDLALDAQGRLHVLAGQDTPSRFYVFSLDRNTGQVIRWSPPGAVATFVIDRLGDVQPDSTGRWTLE